MSFVRFSWLSLSCWWTCRLFWTHKCLFNCANNNFDCIKPWITSDFCYCRKGQPVVEFIFAATEEAIFVHAVISAKFVSKALLVECSCNLDFWLKNILVILSMFLMSGIYGHFQVVILRRRWSILMIILVIGFQVGYC